MSPDAITLACCLAAIALYKLASWLINRAISRRIQAFTARRAQLERDLTAHRALRNAAIEQQPGDPYSDDRIALEQMFIPTQRQAQKGQS